MADRTLRNCRILIVEDEFLLADDLRRALGEAGAIVLGPVASLEDALHAIRSEQQLDGVVLDVNLGGDLAYPAADLLLQRQVPFAFTTGYDEAVIPPRFAHVPLCQKPINLTQVLRAISHTKGS